MLKIVSDQFGAPTSALELALAVVDLLKRYDSNLHPSGIYHLTGAGYCSWYEFAVEIFDIARKMDKDIVIDEILPIKTIEYPTPAKRPLNSRLNCEKAENILGLRLPTWESSLKNCLEILYASH